MIVASPKSFDAWRLVARRLLASGVVPEQVEWRRVSPPTPSRTRHSAPSGRSRLGGRTERPKVWVAVPRVFLELASLVAYHRDPERWDLLYRACGVSRMASPTVFAIGILTLRRTTARKISFWLGSPPWSKPCDAMRFASSGPFAFAKFWSRGAVARCLASARAADAPLARAVFASPVPRVSLDCHHARRITGVEWSIPRVCSRLSAGRRRADRRAVLRLAAFDRGPERVLNNARRLLFQRAVNGSFAHIARRHRSAAAARAGSRRSAAGARDHRCDRTPESRPDSPRHDTCEIPRDCNH